MASMRNWLKESGAEKYRVAVAHCKAGKGRSGTICCSYLISVEGWKMEDALAQFTAKRMRQGFGHGVSIPSQLRWVSYVDQWTKIGKKYVERPVEIVEIHAWGLREGVKLSVQGYVEDGLKIKTFHTFANDERISVDGQKTVQQASSAKTDKTTKANGFPEAAQAGAETSERPTAPPAVESGGHAVIFKPAEQLILPTSDICIDLERRSSATYSWAMVTAVAHVWFNIFFEGLGDQTTLSTETPTARASGVFHVQWEAMDGIKGSSQKGVRALDRLAIIWRAVDGTAGAQHRVIEEPSPGQPVPESKAADWQGSEPGDVGEERHLGQRAASPASN